MKGAYHTPTASMLSGERPKASPPRAAVNEGPVYRGGSLAGEEPRLGSAAGQSRTRPEGGRSDPERITQSGAASWSEGRLQGLSRTHCISTGSPEVSGTCCKLGSTAVSSVSSMPTLPGVFVQSWAAGVTLGVLGSPPPCKRGVNSGLLLPQVGLQDR